MRLCNPGDWDEGGFFFIKKKVLTNLHQKRKGVTRLKRCVGQEIVDKIRTSTIVISGEVGGQRAIEGTGKRARRSRRDGDLNRGSGLVVVVVVVVGGVGGPPHDDLLLVKESTMLVFGHDLPMASGEDGYPCVD